ncbi:MAG: hypothetical protein ACUVV4_06855 [Candidatus Bathyarchaeia archaeon]
MSTPKSLGWKQKHDSGQAVRKATKHITANRNHTKLIRPIPRKTKQLAGVGRSGVELQHEAGGIRTVKAVAKDRKG